MASLSRLCIQRGRQDTGPGPHGCQSCQGALAFVLERMEAVEKWDCGIMSYTRAKAFSAGGFLEERSRQAGEVWESATEIQGSQRKGLSPGSSVEE